MTFGPTRPTFRPIHGRIDGRTKGGSRMRRAIHTPGGLVLAAEQIAQALHRHRAEVRVMVPHYAMSGGTLIAFAADRIQMAPSAVLGPVDPQLGQWAAASILAAVERKTNVNKIDDQTLIMTDLARKAQD